MKTSDALRTSKFEVPNNQSKSGRQSNLLRVINAQGKAADVARELTRALPDSDVVARQLDIVNVAANILGCRYALVFRVINREALVPLMRELRPLELSRFHLSTGRKPIWLSIAEPSSSRATVLSRRALAPFIFNVAMGPHYGPIHNTQWVSRLGGHLTAIQADIASDPAGFNVDTAQYNRQTQVRYRKNDAFPVGHNWGHWNQWLPKEHDEGAHCMTYWPLDRVDPHLVQQGWEAIAAHAFKLAE